MKKVLTLSKCGKALLKALLYIAAISIVWFLIHWIIGWETQLISYAIYAAFCAIFAHFIEQK